MKIKVTLYWNWDTQNPVVLWLLDWNSAALIPLCKGLNAGLELVVLEKSPKTRNKCKQKG